jgi:uncharacterized membrane protein (DUF485 family)
MNPKKQANLRRSIVIKVLLIYLAVALLILFVSSFIGFFLGGPEGATFALGIGILINLLAFPVVGIWLTSRLKTMAAEEASSTATISSMPNQPTKAHPTINAEEPAPPAEKPSA